MKKRKILLFATIITIFILTSCSESVIDEDDYAAGQKDAVMQIKDAAESNWYMYYVDLDELQKVLAEYCDSSTAEDIRDTLKIYDTSDIVEDVIDNNCSFDY